MHAFGLETFTAEHLTVTAGHATAPHRPGHGIEFDRERLGAYRVT